MATYSLLSDIVNQAVFQNRVHLAMQQAAWSVYSEDTATVGHTERAAYANKVATGTANVLEVCYLVLTNPSVAAEADPTKPPDCGIPDSDIQFAVNSYWNLLAGV
jgi:hypothetical protein